MIDIKILRTNPDLVRKALHDKVTKVDLDRVIELDTKRIPLKQQLDEIRAERNKLSDAMGKGKPEPALIEKGNFSKNNCRFWKWNLRISKRNFSRSIKRFPISQLRILL
ncbi:MAG: hypothetical protein WC774_05950 [Candidatus Gracilibacteria bacterium]